jgi:REP element-mobilizing transposase RayT
MLRGINRQNIFENKGDRIQFLEILTVVKDMSKFKLYGYCLMGNHVHILLQVTDEPLALIMKRIGVRYVGWFNRTYKRTGPLFQDRFKSETVQDESYLLAALRYIHQNPVMAGIAKSAKSYEWSSYGDYLGKGSGITDVEELLPIFSPNSVSQKDEFEKFMNDSSSGTFIDVDSNTDEVLKSQMKRLCNVSTVAEFQALSQADRDANIHILRKQGMSIRTIVRLTGIPFGVVRSK